MAQRLPLTADLGRYRVGVTLEDVDVVLHVYWLQRCSGWYVDFEIPDGTPISTGIRLTPGAVLAAPGSAEGLPPGRFVCVGPDSYSFADLGPQVQVVYFTAAEVAEAGEA